MKKLVAVLMCLIVILSFSSCLNSHTSIDPESETPSSSDEPPIHVETDYGDVIALYRKVIDACSIYDKENSDSFYAEKYGITDPQEKSFLVPFGMRHIYIMRAMAKKTASLQSISLPGDTRKRISTAMARTS